MNLDQAFRELGIPSDRAGLVKRNVELKSKLVSALKALKTFQEAHHEGYRHPDALGACPNKVCAGMLRIISELTAS